MSIEEARAALELAQREVDRLQSMLESASAVRDRAQRALFRAQLGPVPLKIWSTPHFGSIRTPIESGFVRRSTHQIVARCLMAGEIKEVRFMYRSTNSYARGRAPNDNLTLDLSSLPPEKDPSHA